MQLIRNRQSLVDNATNLPDRRARGYALDLADIGIRAVQPRQILQQVIRLNGEVLEVAGQQFDLSQIDNLYVLGVGKAVISMAKAVQEILGERITGGCVVAPESALLNKIEVVVGAHPQPDSGSLSGGKKLLSLARLAGRRDLVVVLISGGGSALAEVPIEGLDLEDVQLVNQKLLSSGLSIQEINTVRQTLSRLKGGGLLRQVFPAQLVGLILSDVVGDQLEFVASGPTVAVEPDWKKSLELLRVAKIPHRIRYRVEEAQSNQTNVDPKWVSAVQNHCFGNNETALMAIKQYASENNIQLHQLRSRVTGEAREVAEQMLSELNSSRPSGKNDLLLWGGETTVTLRGSGKGGRCQEFALATADALAQMGEGIALVAIGTDGRDFGEAAGAIVDSTTSSRAQKLELYPESYLQNNNSYRFFEPLGDLINTGYTGTNVCDLMIAVRCQH